MTQPKPQLGTSMNADQVKVKIGDVLISCGIALFTQTHINAVYKVVEIFASQREQEVARACAKAMCAACAGDVPMENRPTEDFYHEEFVYCEATPIRKLCPEAFK